MILEDIYLYGLVLSLSAYVGICSLGVHVVRSCASKKAILSFIDSLSPILRKLYFGKTSVLFGYNDIDEFYEKINKFADVFARFTFPLVIVLIEVVHIVSKLRMAETLDMGVILNVVVWVSIYIVTFVASWRFGRKIKDFENLQPEE